MILLLLLFIFAYYFHAVFIFSHSFSLCSVPSEKWNALNSYNQRLNVVVHAILLLHCGVASHHFTITKYFMKNHTPHMYFASTIKHILLILLGVFLVEESDEVVEIFNGFILHKKYFWIVLFIWLLLKLTVLCTLSLDRIDSNFFHTWKSRIVNFGNSIHDSLNLLLYDLQQFINFISIETGWQMKKFSLKHKCGYWKLSFFVVDSMQCFWKIQETIQNMTFCLCWKI